MLPWWRGWCWLSSGWAVAIDEPMIVPSLGPTVFLVVFAPRLQVARPRNIVGGHLIAVACGVMARVLFDLYGSGSALAGGFSALELSAAVVALSATALFTSGFRLTHPPSAATALVVGLGLAERLGSLGALAGGVVLVTVVGDAVARAAGLRLGSGDR